MPQTTPGPDHVAVLAFPFSTHAAPLLAIIHRLATSSPNTHFSFFNTQQSNNSIFSIYEQNTNIKAYDVWDGVPEGYVFSGKPQEHIELFMKSAPNSFKKAMEVAVSETGRKVSCLVSDAFFWFAGEMAEEIGVVWLPFWTAGPASLSAHVYTDLIRDTFGVGGVAGHEDELLSLIPGMSKIRIRDLPEGKPLLSTENNSTQENYYMTKFSLISGGPRRVTGTVEFLLWGNPFPIVILMEIGVSPHLGY
ncbi:hypothetical protein D5086_024915 [Populus alba]|uniref:Uncharacterized protein n=1 Tax=Populus alba TaxID=43335 RepID=A0ACC4B6W1_POPAL